MERVVMNVEAAAEASDADARRVEEEAAHRRQRHMAVAARWRAAYRRLRATLLLSRQRPHFPIERLSELRRLFTDAAGRLVELRQDEFVAAFTEYFGAGMYTRVQLTQWFCDVDVDASDRVSWDEFTNFMIHEAVGVDTEYSRAKEFLAHPHPAQTLHAHRDAARLLLVNANHGTIISAGFDGLIKVWDAETLHHIKTINNTHNSVAHTEAASGMSSGPCPIIDIVLGAKGNMCFVAAVDKSVHLYEARKMTLVRRYIGRNRYSELDVSARFVGGSRAPVDTVLLMHMEDTIASLDVGVVDEREYLFLGFMDGRISAYLALRNSSAVEIFPRFTSQTHRAGAVARLRFIPELGGLLSCGWDRAMCLSNPRDGAVTQRFSGSSGEFSGHTKAAFDFCFNRRTRVLASIANERDIFIWNPTVEAPITKLRGHMALLLAVAFNENENQLVSLSQDSNIKLWDMRTYRLFQSFTHTESFTRLTAISFCPRRSVMYALAGEVHAWYIRRAQAGFGVDYSGHIEPVVGVAYMHEYSSIVTCDPHTAMTWDLMTGKRQIVWRAEGGDGASDAISAIALDWRMRRLLAATRTRQVLVYNHRNTQLLRDIVCGSSSLAHAAQRQRTKGGDGAGAQSHRSSPSRCGAKKRSGVGRAHHGGAENPAALPLPSTGEQLQRLLAEDVPVAVIHVANRELSSKHTCVLTRHDLFLIRDPDGDTEGQHGAAASSSNFLEIHRISARTGRFNTMCMYPATGATAVPSLVVGTSDARMLLVSVASAAAIASVPHPMPPQPSAAPDRRRLVSVAASSVGTPPPATPCDLPGLRFGDDGGSGGAEPRFLQRGSTAAAVTEPPVHGESCGFGVESVTYIPRCDLFVSVVASATLFFWDFARKNAVRLSCATRIAPSERLVLVSAEPTGALLACADEQGYVYLRDIAALPHNRASATYHAQQLRLTGVFKAHTAGLVQLKLISAQLLLTAGNDALVKLFSAADGGALIGCFGQATPWWLPNRGTWGSHAVEFAPELDPGEVTPAERPPSPSSTHGGRRALRSPGGSVGRSPPLQSPLATSPTFLTTTGDCEAPPPHHHQQPPFFATLSFSASTPASTLGRVFFGSGGSTTTAAQVPENAAASDRATSCSCDPPPHAQPAPRDDAAPGGGLARASGLPSLPSYQSTLRAARPTTSHLPLSSPTRRPRLLDEERLPRDAAHATLERLMAEGRELRRVELAMAATVRRESLDAGPQDAVTTAPDVDALQLADEARAERRLQRIASRKSRQRPWHRSLSPACPGDAPARVTAVLPGVTGAGRGGAATPDPTWAPFTAVSQQFSRRLHHMRATTPSVNSASVGEMLASPNGAMRPRLGVQRSTALRAEARRGIVAPNRRLRGDFDVDGEESDSEDCGGNRREDASVLDATTTMADAFSHRSHSSGESRTRERLRSPSEEESGWRRSRAVQKLSRSGAVMAAEGATDADGSSGRDEEKLNAAEALHHRQSLPKPTKYRSSVADAAMSLTPDCGAGGANTASALIAQLRADDETTRSVMAGALQRREDEQRRAIADAARPFSVHNVRGVRSVTERRIVGAIKGDPKGWTDRAAALLPLNPLTDIPGRSGRRGDAKGTTLRTPATPRSSSKSGKPLFK